MQYKSNFQKFAYFTLKQSNQPILWIDQDGTILHVNDATCRMSGFNRDELEEGKIFDLHPEEDIHTWKEQWLRLLEQKKLFFEKWQPTRKGTWLRLKVMQNLIEMDGQAYSVSIIEDRTEEYAMEKKVQESERRLATLMSNLPGMAYRCLRDENWTMEFVSEGCKKLTGYASADLTGNRVLSYNSIIIPEDREMVKKQVGESLAHHQFFEIKYRIRQPSGEIRWVWERGTAVPDDNDQLTAIEGFVTDITAIKHAEQELIEKEQALRKLKDQLEEETIYLREEIKLNSNFEEIISRSEVFRKVLKQVEQVAATDSTVLIQGETGTGM